VARFEDEGDDECNWIEYSEAPPILREEGENKVIFGDNAGLKV
jgi:hypothetical protein